MRTRSLLLGSVSLAAVSAASAVAQAEDLAVPDGYTLSVEGGFLMGPNDVARDKLGSGVSAGIVDIQDNFGYRAAISLGKQIDPAWDLRVGGSLNHQLESISSWGSGVIFSSGYGEFRTDFDFENLDFEVGYRPTLDDNFDVRLFAGVRGLHYTDSQRTVGSEKLGPGNYVDYDFGVTSEFVGAGPRIGAEASTRLGDSAFGISGMVSGALLYGLERSTADGEFTVVSGGNVIQDVNITDSMEEWKSVIDVAASLGLDYHVSDETTVTLGYRAQQLMNIGPASGGMSSGGEGNRLAHGPFLKLVSQF